MSVYYFQYAESECDRILATIPKLQTLADVSLVWLFSIYLC